MGQKWEKKKHHLSKEKVADDIVKADEKENNKKFPQRSKDRAKKPPRTWAGEGKGEKGGPHGSRVVSGGSFPEIEKATQCWKNQEGNFQVKGKKEKNMQWNNTYSIEFTRGPQREKG